MNTQNDDRATAEFLKSIEVPKIETLISHLKIKAESGSELDKAALKLAEEIQAEHAALVAVAEADHLMLNGCGIKINI